MKLVQRLLPPVDKTQKISGTWVQQRHGLYANSSFGRVGTGPKEGEADLLEQSAIFCGIDYSIDYLGKTGEVVVVEIGAGWGRQTIRAAGYCKSIGQDIQAYAVEADPTHYDWLCQTIRYNNVNCVPLYGAMCDKVGWSKFRRSTDPANDYGQMLIEHKGNTNVYHVPTLSLAWLFKTFQLSHIHVLHMDAQGAETSIIAGALDYLSQIDNIIIGTHGDSHNTEIPKLFAVHSPKHEVCVNILKHSGLQTIPGFTKAMNFHTDGLLILSKV